MISTSTIIACVVTLLISLILPVVILIFYGIKNKGKGIWSAWLLGAAGFFVMQIIIRMSFLSLLSMQDGFMKFVSENYVLYCVILGFTAALFELVARFTVAKIMSKNLTYERSFAAGLGHGGIEAMFLVGMTYINNLIYIFMIMSGMFDTVVEQTAATGVDVSQLDTIKETLISTPSVMFMLGGFERILTMTAHVAMTMIVCYAMKKGKTAIGLLICLGMHTFIDASIGIINGMATEYLGNVISQTTAYIIIYALLSVVTVASVAVVINIRKRWKGEEAIIEKQTEFKEVNND